MNREQRHLGRELALQWLFPIDIGRSSPDEVMAEVPDEFEGVVEAEGAEFARQLVNGVIGDRKRIDSYLNRYSKGWPLDRMAGVERNVLRIALFEILDLPDIPASVSIDEAIDVAKRYATDESGKFVNGILGAFMRGEMGDTRQA